MKNQTRLLAVALLFSGAQALAQEDVKGDGDSLPLGPAGVAIPDNLYRGGFGGATMACVNVAGPGSGNVNNMTVTLPITHTWVGDLVLKIAKVDGANAPISPVVTLMSRPGAAETDDLGGGTAAGDSSNLLNTFPTRYADAFTVSAETMGSTIPTGGVVCQPPTAGDGICDYMPNPGAAAAGNLATFNGTAASGTWRICVGDRAAADTGSVFPATIDFGTGGGGAGNLTITPATVPFGNQNVGTTSAASTVTLANTGTASLMVTALTAPTAPFARTGGTCGAAAPFAIANGASCTLTYTYAPTTATASNQVLTVTADSPGSGTITLTGTGVAPLPGVASLSAGSVNFGNTGVGQNRTTTVTLSNTGAGPLQVTGITAAAAPFALTGGTCTAVPFTLAPATSCTLIYTFSPTAQQSSSQTLTITTNGGNPTLVLIGNGLLVAQSIPTLSNLALLLLIVLMGGVTMVGLRRR